MFTATLLINSQKLEMIQNKSTSKWISYDTFKHWNSTKQYKKTTDTCNNMDNYHRYYVTRKKLNTKWNSRKDNSNF